MSDRRTDATARSVQPVDSRRSALSARVDVHAARGSHVVLSTRELDGGAQRAGGVRRQASVVGAERRGGYCVGYAMR